MTCEENTPALFTSEPMNHAKRWRVFYSSFRGKKCAVVIVFLPARRWIAVFTLISAPGFNHGKCLRTRPRARLYLSGDVALLLICEKETAKTVCVTLSRDFHAQWNFNQTVQRAKETRVGAIFLRIYSARPSFTTPCQFILASRFLIAVVLFAGRALRLPVGFLVKFHHFLKMCSPATLK